MPKNLPDAILENRLTYECPSSWPVINTMKRKLTGTWKKYRRSVQTNGNKFTTSQVLGKPVEDVKGRILAGWAQILQENGARYDRELTKKCPNWRWQRPVGQFLSLWSLTMLLSTFCQLLWFSTSVELLKRGHLMYLVDYPTFTCWFFLG